MFPQAEVCDLHEGVGILWADEALFIAGRQVSEAVCMIRAFALVADDQRAAVSGYWRDQFLPFCYTQAQIPST